VRAFHSDEEATLTDLPRDALVKRLARERKARLEAENLLEKKSLELYESNQDLADSLAQYDKERVLLSAVFNARSSGLVLTDSALGIVRLNLSASSLMGVPQDPAPDVHLTTFVAGDEDTNAWIRARSGPHASYDDSTVEGEVTRENGETLPVRMSCTEIGQDGLLLWILTDIRQQLKIEAERHMLERSLTQAQKMEALGTLASGVAHEINTPIQYVGDNVRFLQEFHDAVCNQMQAFDRLKAAAEQENLLPDLVSAASEQYETDDMAFLLDEAPVAIDQSLHGLQQVASIVSAIREFSHPGDAELKQVDLNLVLETTVSVSRNSWKHVAEIESDYAPNLPNILGQPGDLHQVFLNLISNARDAIEESSPSGGGEIRIETRKSKDWVEVTLSDNGAGIDEETRSRIFDPFFTTKDPGKGTGQGLAIVYKIVNVKHNGQITVDSDPGQGTVFTLRFPCAHQVSP